jgi:DNA damage-inducible protein 1
MRLVDKRYAGKAMGVGSCKILGRIHAADMEIEGKFITCSFTIIENNSVEFLLGLDNLRRFSVLLFLLSAKSTLKRTSSSSRTDSSPPASSLTARSKRTSSPSTSRNSRPKSRN